MSLEQLSRVPWLGDTGQGMMSQRLASPTQPWVLLFPPSPKIDSPLLPLLCTFGCTFMASPRKNRHTIFSQFDAQENLPLGLF